MESYNGDGNNNQLRLEMAAAVMAMATASLSGGSKDNDSATPDTMGGGEDVIGVDSGNKDCGMDARSLSAVVVWL